eukprot:276443-Amphidinium_carterae.1
MERLIRQSDIIRESVVAMEVSNCLQSDFSVLKHAAMCAPIESTLNVRWLSQVQVQGAVYDIVTGEVEWLGEHPNLEEITGWRSLCIKERAQPTSCC